jgi:hypothetical protein
LKNDPPLLGKLRKQLERTVRLLAACTLLALAWPAQAEGQGAEITQFQLERTEEGLSLSVAVHFDLPPVIEDALLKGIPMFFVAEAVLYRDRWYWYDREISRVQRHMRLSYQPLTRRWRLTISPTVIGNSGVGLSQSFDSKDEALAAVQRISRWKIAEPSDLSPHERYNVDFSYRLDVSQLPRPFQIGAVGQADWNISVFRNQRMTIDSTR